ncbi:MAG: trypsin-like peptidase domain-containing protein [Chthoniobacterales bacterium]
MLRIGIGVLVLLLGTNPLLWGKDDITRSVVRIQTVSQEPDYRIPWNSGQIVSGTGAGFVISNNRIMTNAHVVSNARNIQVFKEGVPKPYPAKVRFIAHDCDLAIIVPDDPSFFQGIKPLEFGKLPEIESPVSVFGYPIGGDRLSVTRGIVSRIDFQPYSHSGADSHLTAQIDAAINPGNSGGPVMQDKKIVGVAFQGYSGDVAQNVGYMIPIPVIARFLKDIQDGKYDHYVDLTIGYFPLFNRATRGALGLPDDDHGVYVTDVYKDGSSDGILQKGDVLLSIDGLPIASDGTVELDNDTRPLAEVVERKFNGDKVTMDIWRNRHRETVTIPLKTWPFQLQANAYDVKPRYVLFGGLLFQPVDQNLMRAYAITNLRIRYIFDNFLNEHLYEDRPEIVILSGILPDSVNTYLTDFQFSIVDEINGKKIKNLGDVSEAFGRPEEFYVIKFLGRQRPLVIAKQEADAARARILQRYKVNAEQNLKD